VLRACALGFSGVVFGLMVIEAAADGAPTRVLFGRLPVPAPLLPWATMAVIQVLVPGASLLGHLAGLLAGEAWAAGALAALELSDGALARAEAHPAYADRARAVGGAVDGPAGALPAWQAARARGGAGDGTSSVAAAWRLGRTGAAAAWARVPPAAQEQALAKLARVRLLATEKWRALVAALPPGVVAAVASGHAAAVAWLGARAPGLAAALARLGGARHDGEDEETGSGERAPLLSEADAIGAASGVGISLSVAGGGSAGALGGSAGGVGTPSPARRARPAGAPEFDGS
jgi:hypothetical protein